MNERVNKYDRVYFCPGSGEKMGHFRKTEKLCEENRIPGVAKFSRLWLIPKDAKKPADKRKREENRK